MSFPWQDKHPSNKYTWKPLKVPLGDERSQSYEEVQEVIASW
jgi:hypothetical protein